MFTALAGLEGLTTKDSFRGVEFGSLFREFGLDDVVGGSMFDTFFGRRRGARTRAPQQGADLKYELEVTLEDVAFGCEKKTEGIKQEKCPACGDSGHAPHSGRGNQCVVFNWSHPPTSARRTRKSARGSSN